MLLTPNHAPAVTTKQANSIFGCPEPMPQFFVVKRRTLYFLTCPLPFSGGFTAPKPAAAACPGAMARRTEEGSSKGEL